jgi:trans-2,3-dihydro-3-hydroxyanthranilate isomerase
VGPRWIRPALAAVGLDDADVNGTVLVAGCGLDYTYVPVFDDAVGRAKLNFTGGAVDQFCLFSWNPLSNAAHCRMFEPGATWPEDPATGSAALGLGAWLVACGLLPPDTESSYVVKQGAEVHRPSTLECAVAARDGAAVRVTVGGAVVAIAKGEIAVPPFIG